jgi:archaetidylinositol phosphate synthase
MLPSRPRLIGSLTKPMSSVSNSTWTHRLARPLVRSLLATPIRPNHVTTLRLATGILACLGFALGTRAGMWWGGGFWLLSAFLDRVDGELARLGNMMSAGGHRYDFAADTAVNTLVFVAMGIGLRGSWLGYWSIPLGLIGGASMLLCSLFCEWLLLRSPTSTKPYSGRWGFDPDDALYLLGPLAWLDWLNLVLIGTALGASAMMLVTGIRVQRLRRAHALAS